MNEINDYNFAKDYIDNTYVFEKWIDESKHISIIRSKLDDRLYVLKLREYYDIYVYNTLKNSSFPGVPKIYDLLPTNKGLFIVEEYINGQNVEDYINTLTNREYIISEIVRIGEAVSYIMEKLHRLSPPIIHRDIKPQNVIISDSNIYLVDFNIARTYSGTVNKDTLLMGTREYAAPEQYGFKESDERTDIYGLGATLQHLIDISNVTSPDLEKVIRKTVEMDPDNRYQSMSEFRNALNNIGSHTPLFDDYLKKHKHPYAPPGFRNNNIVHILVASLVYFLLIYLVFTFKMGGNPYTGHEAHMYNISGAIYVFINALFTIFYICDYLNLRTRIMWNYLKNHPTKSKEIFLSVLVYLLIVFVVFMFFVIFISIFFRK